MVVNVHHAKTHLSQLLERVTAGEEVVIAKAGQPVARLIPYRASETPRTLGIWRGKVEIAPDFDELPPALQATFAGGEP